MLQTSKLVNFYANEWFYINEKEALGGWSVCQDQYVF